MRPELTTRKRHRTQGRPGTIGPAFPLRSPWLILHDMDALVPVEQPSTPVNKPMGRAHAAPRCGAKGKRTGKPCRAPAMPNGRCHKHGGATPHGLALPQTTHGRYSKYMPAGPIADAYAAMYADRTQLHNLADDIATLEGFRAEALSQQSGAEIATLTSAIEAIAAALTSSKPISSVEASQQLSQLATMATDAQAAKRKAVQASHDKAKLIETDLKRQAQQDRLVTRDQAIAFGFAIVDACRQKLAPEDAQWLAHEAQRAAARFILGTDPDSA